MLLASRQEHIMAFADGAMTLAQYALQMNMPQVAAVSWSLIDYGNVFQDIPLINKETLIANGVRFEGNLPTVTWAQLNAVGGEMQATPTPYQENAYITRNYVTADKFLLRDVNQIGNVRANQVKAGLKALTYDQNDKFFNNNHVTGDANAFVGIRARIDDAAGANKFGVRPENKIDAGGTDLSDAGITQKTANAFLKQVDKLLWSVDAPMGDGVILYANDDLVRTFNLALRTLGTSGGLSTAQDQFDRTIMKYKNAIIRDPGLKADQSTKVITSTETNTGANGSSTFTSMYAVNYSEDHFFGWQFEPVNVQDLGILNDGVLYRTLIDWAVGLMNASTRSLGRLYDIKLA